MLGTYTMNSARTQHRERNPRPIQKRAFERDLSCRICRWAGINGWLGFRYRVGHFRKAILRSFVQCSARCIAVHTRRGNDDERANVALHFEQLIGMTLSKGNRVDHGIRSVSQRKCQLIRLFTIKYRDARAPRDQFGRWRTTPAMSDDNTPASVQKIARNGATNLAGASQNERLTCQCCVVRLRGSE
jgi:hypothetical protein